MLLYAGELERWRARAGRRGRGHRRRARAATGAGASASSPTLDRRAPASIPARHGRVGLRPRGDDALRRRARCAIAASPAERIHLSLERNMQCAIGATAATASSARRSSASDGPVFAYDRVAPLADGAGAVMAATEPKLAVWKFASCDGCQLTLLDCEDELLALAGRIEIALLPRGVERGRRRPLRPLAGRGLDHHGGRRRAHPARSAQQSRRLVTIGACATAGGIQALRNFADVDDFIAARLRRARSTSRRSPPRRRSPAHVHGRLRAARLPDRQAPAARGASAPSCDERRPAHRARTASASSASGAATSA